MDMGLKTFLVGSAGALAPEVVRLYTLATGGQRMTWSPGFYIPVSIAFAALGGLIAMVLPSENLQTALYTGIATPVLVSTVLKKAQGPQTTQQAPAPVKSLGAGSVPAPAVAPRLSRVASFLDAL